MGARGALEMRTYQVGLGDAARVYQPLDRLDDLHQAPEDVTLHLPGTGSRGEGGGEGKCITGITSDQERSGQGEEAWCRTFPKRLPDGTMRRGRETYIELSELW